MVKNYVYHAGLKKDPQHLLHKPFTQEQEAVITARFADDKTDAIATAINRTVQSVRAYAAKNGLKKSAAFMASDASGRLKKGDTRGAATRLKKGNVPWSKGKKMPEHIREKIARTFFKKGQLPHNTKQDGQVSVRVDVKGRRYRWIRTGLNEWKQLHRHLWEEAYGPIPDGHRVSFKDGNQEHCVLENLELVIPVALRPRKGVQRLPTEPTRAALTAEEVERRRNERAAAKAVKAIEVELRKSERDAKKAAKAAKAERRKIEREAVKAAKVMRPRSAPKPTRKLAPPVKTPAEIAAELLATPRRDTFKRIEKVAEELKMDEGDVLRIKANGAIAGGFGWINVTQMEKYMNNAEHHA